MRRYRRHTTISAMQTKNILLLIVRLIAGGIIGYAGYNKLINMEGTIAGLGQGLGLSEPIVWAVALGELLAGLGLVFGVLTRTSAVGAGIIMIGALYYTHGGGDLKTATMIGSVLIGSALILVTGGGKYSVLREKNSCPVVPTAQPTASVPPSNNPQM